MPPLVFGAQRIYRYIHNGRDSDSRKMSGHLAKDKAIALVSGLASFGCPLFGSTVRSPPSHSLESGGIGVPSSNMDCILCCTKVQPSSGPVWHEKHSARSRSSGKISSICWDRTSTLSAAHSSHHSSYSVFSAIPFDTNSATRSYTSGVSLAVRCEQDGEAFIG